MTDYTVQQLRDAARRAYEAGNIAAAEELAQAGIALEKSQPGKRIKEIGSALYENIVGSGEVDTPGERLGATINDMVMGAETGARRTLATLADTPGMALNAVGDVVTGGLERAGIIGAGVGQGARDALRSGPLGSGSTATDGINALTGDSLGFEPKTRAGRYAQSVGEFLPGAGSGFGSFALAPGILAEAAGELTRDRKFDERLPLVGGQDMEPYARTAAALAAPTAVNAAKALVTPNPADPARIAAAKRLADEGIDTTAGQRTGSRTLQFRERGIDATADVVDGQNEQFTAASLRRIGARDPDTLQPATRATPEVIRQAADDIGEMFDEVAESAFVQADDALTSSVNQAVEAFEFGSVRGDMPGFLKELPEKIAQAAKNNTPITGKQYQKWRSQLSRLTIGSDKVKADAAADLINALDGAMARSIKDPDTVKLYGKARQRWQDFLAIRDATTMAGEDAAAGILSPRQIRGKVTAGSGKASYASGDRDLSALTRDANTVISPMGDMQQDLQLARMARDVFGGGGASGAAALAITKDPQVAAMVGGAGAMLPMVGSAALGTPLLQRYLMNQLATSRTAKMTPGLLGAALASSR